jgi:chloramphenicol 3-O-phosphotransferase
MLVHKDRTILDRNRAAAAMGCVPGTRCVDRGAPAAHKGCLANQALREGTAKRSVQYVETMKVVMDSYWIPLPEHADMFVHFGIDITPYAAERLLKQPEDDCAECKLRTVSA